MNHQIIERLVTFWKGALFLEPLLMLLFIVGFIVAIVRQDNQRERAVFILYFFVGVTIFLGTALDLVFKSLSVREYHVILEINNTAFELVEYATFYYFFRKRLRKQVLKRISKMFLFLLAMLSLVFFLAIAIGTYESVEIEQYSLIINVLELLFLASLCLAYFYELFTNVTTVELLGKPSFYIATSTFFYAVLPIPFFLLAAEILQRGKAIYLVFYDCHYLLLLLVLVSILKALLSKVPFTT